MIKNQYFVLFCLLLIVSHAHSGAKSNSFFFHPYSLDALEPDTSMLFIENGRIKLGIDMNLGGAITYLSDQKNGGENMINSYDWGRQIQMSYYSGPWPYIGPNGEKPTPEWSGLGWNPIQSGDAGGHRSKVISYEKKGNNAILVRSIPMQWPHKTGVAGECEFQTLYTLKNNVITMKSTIINKRLDTVQYMACMQEMPAVYTNGPWYKLVTYLGDQPFKDQPTTVIVDKDDEKGWPWVNFYTPENWVALMDDQGYGIGVFQPEVMSFNGGFHPNKEHKGFGAEKDVQTGHIAPVGRQILDHNIQWTYQTALILGTLEDIRGYAKDNWKVNVNPEWKFTQDRNDWYFINEMKDSGFPWKGVLDLDFNKEGTLVGPVTFWNAEDNPHLEIEGTFLSESGDMELRVEVQPVGASDYTDWLNWSEGKFDVKVEKEKKADQYPKKGTLVIKKKIVADGKSRKIRIDLDSDSQYNGAMKNMKIIFSNPGKAKVSIIKLVK